jgi:hypothetical protein
MTLAGREAGCANLESRRGVVYCNAQGRESLLEEYDLSFHKRYIKGYVKRASIYEGRNVQLDRNTNRSIYITIHSALTNYDEQPKRGSRCLLSKN